MNDKLKGVLIVHRRSRRARRVGRPGQRHGDQLVIERLGGIGVALTSPAPRREDTPCRPAAGPYLDSKRVLPRTGLIKQLKYEGYSLADATYAVDQRQRRTGTSRQPSLRRCPYLDSSAFSRSGLMDQLLYEGFTQSQASYGVSVAY